MHNGEGSLDETQEPKERDEPCPASRRASLPMRPMRGRRSLCRDRQQRRLFRLDSTSEAVDDVDNFVSELFPALLGVGARLSGSDRQRCVEQQHAVFGPGSQVSASTNVSDPTSSSYRCCRGLTRAWAVQIQGIRP